jgi:hypothetical protein
MTIHIASRAALVAALLACAPAQALIFRAYLASDGNDANPCTLPAPCRLLPAALNAVASGGEIWMLDSANYNTGTVTIGKSVSIEAVPGALGSIVMNGAHAVQVSAAGLVVSLRNVSIVPVVGVPGFGYGVSMTGNSDLILDRVLIANFPDDAVRVSSGRLKVIDSVVRDSLNGWAFNIQSEGQAAISGTRMLNNGDGGVLAYGTGSSKTVVVTVSDCVISNRGFGHGATASTTAQGAVARLSLQRVRIDGMTIGARAETDGPDTGTAVTSVSGSMIVNNAYAFTQSQAGSTLYSMLDNHVIGNTNASTGTVTPLAAQ